MLDNNATLTTTRTIPGTPHQVFAAFQNPELLAQWWGPKGFTNTFSHFDFTPGGRWVFVMHAPNGANYQNENIFRLIEQDSRIVIEHILQPWFILTITLAAVDNGTELTWAQRFETSEVAEQFRPLAATANEQNLDRLTAVLTKTA
ncbi:MAG TPA: SRPBCC domain-containing protein [Bryobacteraceae bacterium]|nr:SRPBCC domain-containing protein [Bryobacteraceae bacterium]